MPPMLRCDHQSPRPSIAGRAAQEMNFQGNGIVRPRKGMAVLSPIHVSNVPMRLSGAGTRSAVKDLPEIKEVTIVYTPHVFLP